MTDQGEVLHVDVEDVHFEVVDGVAVGESTQHLVQREALRGTGQQEGQHEPTRRLVQVLGEI